MVAPVFPTERRSTRDAANGSLLADVLGGVTEGTDRLGRPEEVRDGGTYSRAAVQVAE